MNERKLLLIFGGIMALLVVMVTVMIGRYERLKKSMTKATPAQVLPSAVAQDLASFQEFVHVMTKNGWKWDDYGAQALGDRWLKRGRFVGELPDFEGSYPVTGVDLIRYPNQAAREAIGDAFPLEERAEWYPLVRWSDGKPQMQWQSVPIGSALAVFYELSNDSTSVYLADEFTRYLTVKPGEESAFAQRIGDLNQLRFEQFSALKAIQEALKKIDLYQGEVDGVFGWRSKRALQSFLQTKNCYSGDIDGVFGNASFRALTKYREIHALPLHEQNIDMTLAQAIESDVDSTVAQSGAPPN